MQAWPDLPLSGSYFSVSCTIVVRAFHLLVAGLCFYFSSHYCTIDQFSGLNSLGSILTEYRMYFNVNLRLINVMLPCLTDPLRTVVGCGGEAGFLIICFWLHVLQSQVPMPWLSLLSAAELMSTNGSWGHAWAILPICQQNLVSASFSWTLVVLQSYLWNEFQWIYHLQRHYNESCLEREIFLDLSSYF